MSDPVPTDARSELRAVILAAIESAGVDGTPAEAAADAVMRKVSDIDERWHEVDITTWADDAGSRVLVHRVIVAEVFREVHERVTPRPNRSVPSGLSRESNPASTERTMP